MYAPALVLVSSTLDEAENARDAYFSAHPDELARFDDAPNLIVELRTQPTEIGNG